MGRPKKEDTNEPIKAKPVITEDTPQRAQPKIVTVHASASLKRWYLIDKTKGNKTPMNRAAAERLAGKYPNQYAVSNE